MGSAVIFSGTKVKTLKSAIDLNGGNDIISSATDPTGSAVSANIGSLLLNSSNGKLYRKNDSGSSTNWTEVGASGQSGINYISNPNAVLNTTGWSTYADAAGASPVDGTGGSPNVTWTRSTTTPLRGAADFNFAKDAANRQGQGVSVDFTIDNADIAKPLTVTFDYEVLSGTYATGDLTVYLIADPAGTPVVIQPAGYQIQSAVAGTKMRNIATFQTQASGVSYRLCFHVASTSAIAYDLALDNVVVGPQVVQYGAPVTDWVSFTPTGSFTTNTTYTGYWRRVGDSAEFDINMAFAGAPNSVSSTINIPFGWNIDTSKIAVSSPSSGRGPRLGIGSQLRSGTSQQWMEILYSSATAVAAQYHSVTGAIVFQGNVTQAAPVTIAANDVINVRFSVPIVGWSSTVVMSSDTDTRVVAARVFKNGTQGPTSGTFKITTYTVDRDTHGMWDSTNHRFNILVPGDYQLFIQTNALPATTSTQVPTYRVNAGSDVYLGTDSALSTQSRFNANTIIPNLKAGDYIEIYHLSSANTTIQSGTANTFASLSRISGPSAIAASETVSASYYISTGGGQSIANTGDIIVNYATKVFDSHNAVTTGASWKFTAPVAGKYQVNESCWFVSSVYSIANITYINIYKNGAYLLGGPATTAQTTTSVLLSNSASAIISLNAGDYIDFRVSNNRTAGATTTGDGQAAAISIIKVGI